MQSNLTGLQQDARAGQGWSSPELERLMDDWAVDPMLLLSLLLRGLPRDPVVVSIGHQDSIPEVALRLCFASRLRLHQFSSASMAQKFPSVFEATRIWRERDPEDDTEFVLLGSERARLLRNQSLSGLGGAALLERRGLEQSRTLDSIASRFAGLDLIWLCDASRSAELLSGGIEAIERFWPLLLLGVASADPADRQTMIEQFVRFSESHGYTVFDANLRQLSPQGSTTLKAALREAPFFVAIPAAALGGEQQQPGSWSLPSDPTRAERAEALAESLLGAHAPSAPAAEQSRLLAMLRPRCTLQLALAAQAGQRAADCGRLKARLRNWSRTYPADESLWAEGLHRPERAGSLVWRWTGPGRSTRIVLSYPVAGTYRIVLRVLSEKHADLLERAVFFINGTEVKPEVRRSGQEALVSFSVYLLDSSDHAVELVIALPEVRTASTTDPRRVGLNLRACELRRIGD